MRARDFVQKRKELYEECEDFIEQLLEDKGKPWYTFVKRDAERISEKIAHVRDIKDLERYEQDLKRLKADIKRVKERVEQFGSIDSKALNWMLSHRVRETKGGEFDEIAFLDWIPAEDRADVELMLEEGDWAGLLFYEELGRLHKEYESLTETIAHDRGKPWYSLAKMIADRIHNGLNHSRPNRDLDELAVYEQELNRLKAELIKIRNKESDEVYQAFLEWQGREEILERDRDRAKLILYKKQEELYKDCMELVEQLIEDMEQPWYHSVRSRADRICEKIAYAWNIKKLKEHEIELKRLKEKIKRLRERSKRF